MQRSVLQHSGKRLPTCNTPLQGSQHILLRHAVKARRKLMLHSTIQRIAATVWGGKKQLDLPLPPGEAAPFGLGRKRSMGRSL